MFVVSLPVLMAVVLVSFSPLFIAEYRGQPVEYGLGGTAIALTATFVLTSGVYWYSGMGLLFSAMGAFVALIASLYYLNLRASNGGR